MKIKNILTGLALTMTGLYITKKAVENIKEVQIIEPKERVYDLEDKSVVIIDVEKYEEVQVVTRNIKRETLKDKVIRIFNRKELGIQ